MRRLSQALKGVDTKRCATRMLDPEEDGLRGTTSTRERNNKDGGL